MFVTVIFSLLIASSNAYFLSAEECLNYTIYPVQYEFDIYPYIFADNKYYDCHMTITVIVNAPIQIIELDAKDLDINGDSIQVLEGNINLVNKYRPYEYDKKRGKLIIYLNEVLKVYSEYKTQYYVKVSFRKVVKSDSTGVFLVEYDDRGSKYLFTTRLSPNKAKYFFPCVDNPLLEAIFKVRVNILSHQKSLQKTNTSLTIAKEITEHSYKNNYLVIDYMPSPQILAHQFGFHLSQFGFIEQRIASTNDIIAIWAPHETLHYYTSMLQLAENVVKQISAYTSSNRSLVNGVINVVAVPDKIASYEIDSWNLWTIGDYRLAYNPKYVSTKQQEKMEFDFTEQLCRVWLGNPGEISRTRWREEWFKIGMATYYAYYFNHNQNYEDMRMKAMAMDDWHHSVPALDTFNNTLAALIPLRYIDLVRLKTASILWMVENWLGSYKFHQALVKYINNRRGQRITLNDFMDFLDKETVECQNQFFNGYTASRILDSWFHRPGYPVIEVEVLRDRTPNAIHLKQRQFSFTHQNKVDSDYLIPISYIVQNYKNCYNCYQPKFTINTQSYSFEENLNGGWIILNRNASGYYRVNYDIETWHLIAKTLKENHETIDHLNRAQIVNDIFALYSTGAISYHLAFDILDYLDQENDLAVWSSAIDGFELLKREGAACNMNMYSYAEWKNFMAKKVGPVYNRLVSNNHFSVKMTKIIEFAIAIGYQPCILHLKSMHKDYGVNLDSDLRQAWYYIADNERVSTDVYNRYQEEDVMIAVNKVRQEKKFQHRIGGIPPQPMISTSSEAPIPKPTKSPQTQQTPSNGTNITSIKKAIVFGFATLILIILR